MGFDSVTMEARCWNFTTRLKEPKENVDILNTLEEEVKAEKEIKKPKGNHPDYDNCECIDSSMHSEALAKAKQEAKEKKVAKKAKVKARTDRFPKDGGRPI